MDIKTRDLLSREIEQILKIYILPRGMVIKNVTNNMDKIIDKVLKYDKLPCQLELFKDV